MIHSKGVNTRLVTGFSFTHPSLYINDSEIEGKGIFTEVPLASRTALFDIVAEKIRYKNDPRVAGENPNWIGCGFEEWLKVGPGDIASYLNHSCSPNVVINEKLQLITIKPVEANEELVLDYSTTELDPYWEMECICSSPECRKVLRSFQFLPDDLKNRYRTFIAPVYSNMTK